MRLFSLPSLVLLLAGALGSSARADDCRVLETKVFAPQGKKVMLIAADATEIHRAVVFQTKLRVNTDGAPNSYHPHDLAGREKAINHICNAISVKTVPGGERLKCKKAVEVFAEFRDAGWKEPAGHAITWANVIAARVENGRKIPCVFQEGEHEGYLGSLTHLNNGLPPAKRGECEAANQLDQRFVPALVMAGGSNPVRDFGGGVGDLVVAFNPKTGITIAAVIGDSGPPDNLGEGSVALNMALLGRTEQPKTYTEAKKLDTGEQEILVAVLPGSKTFDVRKPFTKENIETRVSAWVRQAGFEETAAFVDLARRCASGS